jgi:hypothetical protein
LAARQRTAHTDGEPLDTLGQLEQLSRPVQEFLVLLFLLLNESPFMVGEDPPRLF